MKIYFKFILLIFPFTINAQSTFVPVQNKEYYHLIDRFEIKYPSVSSQISTVTKPYERASIAQMVDSLEKDSTNLSKQDRFNLEYLQNDNWEFSRFESDSRQPILKYFYKKKSDFYSVNTEDFDLHINPVLHLSVGKERPSNLTTYINTRGVEVRGSVNNKVGFYAFAAENQATFPSYVFQYSGFQNALGVPGEGYTKPFKQNGVDFITGRGYITFNITKNIHAQFGHDKNFIGDGYRSLILSDFSNNYTFLKINTNVWKLNYQNIFAELTADVFYRNQLLPKKYFAFHHLSLNLSPSFRIGIFESVIIGRKDSSNNSRFDINYLNPIIFYRSIEQQLGSEDNALLGMDFKWNFLRHFSFYGQIVLDEFLLKEIKAGNGWWGNKQAFQAGLKYIDVVGISNLDLIVEANVVRPFTYTHKDKFTSYTHYNQALAHPLGANFYEGIGILRYQPLKRLLITGKLIYAKVGADSTNTNYGSNIFLSYNTRNSEYGNRIGMGAAENNITFMTLGASYMIKHNLFFDINYTIRNSESKISRLNTNTNFFSVALRWNIPQRLQEF